MVVKVYKGGIQGITYMMDIHTKIALFTYPTPSLDVSHPIVFMYAFTFALDA